MPPDLKRQSDGGHLRNLEVDVESVDSVSRHGAGRLRRNHTYTGIPNRITTTPPTEFFKLLVNV